MKQEFRLVFGVDEIADELADSLFEAGFDDSHVIRSGGRICIVVDDRDTTDLENAIRVAVEAAQSIGVTVSHVEIPAVEHINAELAAN